MLHLLALFFTIVLVIHGEKISLDGDTGQQVPLEDGILPSLYVYGDHFTIGQKVGQTFSLQIHQSLKASSSLTNYLTWIHTTPTGMKTYQDMLSAANESYPEYIDEIEGMGEGSGVSFEKVRY